MQNKEDPWNFSLDADCIIIAMSFKELRVFIWVSEACMDKSFFNFVKILA